jgi:hypothetical protein
MEVNMAETCNGWKNRETWNVALWLNNDPGYYVLVQNFRDHYKKTRSSKVDYQAFLDFGGMDGEKTRDGVAFNDPKVDTRAIVNYVIFD